LGALTRTALESVGFALHLTRTTNQRRKRDAERPFSKRRTDHRFCDHPKSSNVWREPKPESKDGVELILLRLLGEGLIEAPQDDAVMLIA
jgi:hypothetical protein